MKTKLDIVPIADASSNASSDTNQQLELIMKVADNLNLSYDQMPTTFDKAQQDMSSEALQQRLTQAEQDGTDEILAWINAMPSAMSKTGPVFCVQPMRRF